MGTKPQTIVIGGGLGGLWASLRIAEAGFPVKLFSLFEVKRSHSACAQGGINACMDTKGQHDTVWQHVVDTIKGGAYLVNQPPVKSMCEDAPGLLRTFERMGVTFSRTPEGVMDLRLFGGVKNKRTCFAGASTGQQLLYGVDQHARKLEDQGLIEKMEWWEFLSLVQDDDGRARGIVAMDMRTMKLETFAADAVLLASGGLGLVFGRSTMSTNATGAAAGRVYQAGAKFGNGEMIQFHPTGMLGDDKTRLMSEAARGEGGRIWVPKKAGDNRDPLTIPEDERWYFLEEWYPAYGNTVPRDVASRAVWRVTQEHKMGVDGEHKVYLDLTHLDPVFVEKRLHAILEIYRKFQGVDPVKHPMIISPCMHYSMGGLWVDFERDEGTGGMKASSPRNHATSIPGLYACGECDYAYHGANRLGANSLLSASYSGRVAGEAMAAYCKGIAGEAPPSSMLDAELKKQQGINETYLRADGPENPFTIHRELGEVMLGKVNAVRHNDELDTAIAQIKALQERFENISLGESGSWANQSLSNVRQIHEMLILGEVIATSARSRDECRGAHYKPEFELKIPEGKFPGDPEFEDYRAKWMKNNDEWLKTTIAEHTPEGPKISYEEVDISVLPPEQPRDYR
jgi:succinate dehydrogenase / fumarate reductase, flavoprotein subunit